ncbi:MAG: hypothetical protein ACU0DW_14335 [Shimia sp.]
MPQDRIDSSQPESDANPESLKPVDAGQHTAPDIEPVDRDDPPVADLARELPPEAKDAVRLEGDWDDEDGERNYADMAQETKQNLRDNG